MNKLYTPYVFIPSVVREVVEPDQCGVYILGIDEDGFAGMYVGRSDNCIQKRLLTHNYLYTFDYFIFRYAETQEDAFGLECQLWHVYEEGLNLDNCIHPASPPHSGYICPYCHFSKHVTNILV